MTVCFVLLFFILAPLIIFYANGTIMGDGWNILASGGISIQGMESGSDLFIDGKFKDRISFFTRNYFLKNLKPDIYTILVKKDGYNEWTNKITVYPNLVSESSVFMLPIKITTLKIEKFLEIGGENGTTSKKILKPNPDYDMVKTLFEGNLFLGKSASVLSTNVGTSTVYIPGTKENPIENRHIYIWADGGEVFIGWNGDLDSSPKIFCKDSSINIKCQDYFKVYSFNNKVNNLDFFPGESEVIVAVVGENIYAIEAEDNLDKKPQTLYQGTKPDFRIFNNKIYVKDGEFFGLIEI